MKIKKFLKFAIKGRKNYIDIIITSIPQLISLFTGVITSILIAKGLGIVKLGNYTLIMAFTSMFSSFADLGINTTAIRFASKAKHQNDDSLFYAILRWAFRARIALSIVVIIIGMISIPFVFETMWDINEYSKIALYSLINIPLTAIASIPILYYQSSGNFKKNAIVLSLQNLVSFLSVVIIALFKIWNIEWLIIAYLGANLFGTIIFLKKIPMKTYFQKGEEIYCKNFLKIPVYDKKNLENENTFTVYMVFISLFSVVLMKIDLWLIGIYISKSDIAFYNIASKIAIPLMVVFTSIETVIWPKFSQLVDKNETIGMLKRVMILNSIFCIALIFYSLFAPLIIPVLFGQEYKGSIVLAQIFCIRWVISIFFKPVSTAAYNFGTIKLNLVLIIINLLVFVSFNLVFLKKLGIIASVIGYVIIAILGNVILAIKIFDKSILKGKK